MKYEVLSTSAMDEIEPSADVVLGTISADTEAEAGQIANERFKIEKWRIMYVRPLRINKPEKLSSAIQKLRQYEFKCDNYTNILGSDQITINISKEMLVKTLKDVLEEGLGKNCDTFDVKFFGHLSLNDE